MDNQDKIVSKDSNLDSIIYQILNEAYNEFTQCYGKKHSEYIKGRIESITDKVRKTPQYYFGAIASANYEMGVVYTKSDKLSAVLKHEMWHVYNNSASDMEKSLQHIPSRYLNQLEQTGYLRQFYETKMTEYKEKWKDEPERLQHLLVDYEEFKNNRFDFGDSQVEMWTEWFNSQTHLKDMQDNFWDWGNGFFTKSHSSDSFYDSYINIASIISSIIPRDKLLEMYLQTGEYKTDYSYPEMLEEFDKTYGNALSAEEKKTYQYPYLKIIMDVRTTDENARKNPNIALNALQDCMKTCFKAYSIKLDNLKVVSTNDIKQIYDEIKHMQEYMLWNIDISKMQGLEYADLMEEIQNKFKVIVQSLGIEAPELRTMAETIDYRTNNPYKTIENGNEISARIMESQNEDITDITNIESYSLKIGKSEVKGNLYRTLYTILGDEKYNMLFENFQNGKEENPLAKFYNKIENIKNESDIIDIYDEMYALYEQRLSETLKTDENISSLFDQYSKGIVELQRNGMFADKEKRYLPSLENIITLYNQRVRDYIQEIDRIAEEDKERNLREGRTLEQATRFSRKIPDWYIGQLKEQQSRIDIQRDTQAMEFSKMKTIPIRALKKDLYQEKISTTETEQEYTRLANAKIIEDIQLKKQKGQQLTEQEEIMLQNHLALKERNHNANSQEQGNNEESKGEI